MGKGKKRASFPVLRQSPVPIWNEKLELGTMLKGENVFDYVHGNALGSFSICQIKITQNPLHFLTGLYCISCFPRSFSLTVCSSVGQSAWQKLVDLRWMMPGREAAERRAGEGLLWLLKTHSGRGARGAS